MFIDPKISVRSFLREDYVCETTHSGNTTVKRNYKVEY
jgi:hypothetical protein